VKPWCTGLIVLLLSMPGQAENVTISVRDAGIGEVIDMIARQQRVNVLVPAKLSGNISLNLYDVPVEKALAAVANAGGFALEKRGENYFIVAHDEVGRYANGNLTELRWFELNYVDGEKVKEMVESYLSRYGKVSFIANRNLLVVEDHPEFVRRVASLLEVIDKRPRQVMIEAKILEVTLNDDENFGIDWSDLFSGQDGTGEYGTQGFTAGPDAAGFFFNMVTPNVSIALNALRDEGRLHTLSTPKLVALENQEASVVIGDRRGYQVTTTINQVTTESIEFLESGVILRVNVQIDEDERILMSVHPEVSTGTVDANGIPSQTTTEVTTNLLIPSGETVFIGGLIKKSEVDRRQSVPGLNRVPVVRRLFTGTENTQITTETVVLITPVLADDTRQSWNQGEIERVDNSPIPSPEFKVWHPLTRRSDKPLNTEEAVVINVAAIEEPVASPPSTEIVNVETVPPTPVAAVPEATVPEATVPEATDQPENEAVEPVVETEVEGVPETVVQDVERDKPAGTESRPEPKSEPVSSPTPASEPAQPAVRPVEVAAATPGVRWLN
jgi:type II secretory pathway component GspD/PulD (secretin)